MPNTIFDFFGLRENPFKINPDPRFLFVTDKARATSDELTYAIRTRKGLILLTGEVGTGKTMLIRRLLDWLAQQKMPTALIFNSHIKPEHLLDFILNDFGVPCSSTLKSEKLMALNSWLLERYREGQIPVLIVDEAQGLDPAALEEIRLLLNFETPREKLLQIILAGQPELETKLKRHELRQLRQRITIRCRTAPLTLEQTCGYIAERLRIAGANGNPIFEPDAVGSVYAYSHGIPRVINVLCEHSLVNACADGTKNVSSTAVEQAARDCQLDRADSVARILNTSSYSTTSLSDVGSILAAVSAASESSAGPPSWPQFSEACPAPAQGTAKERPHTSNAAPQSTASFSQTTAGRNRPPAEVPQGIPPAPSDPRRIPQSQPLSADSERIPMSTPLAQQPRTPSGPPPLNFLAHWSQSFVSDVRSTSRQVHRALHSFEVHRWKPFVRVLRSELHQLRVRASHIFSEPRWKQIRTRAVSISLATWRSFRSAIPASLAQHLGIHEQAAPGRNPSSASSHPKLPRAIVSLRRWLHRSFSTAQKRPQESRRH